VRIRDTLLPIVWKATRNKTVIRRVPTSKIGFHNLEQESSPLTTSSNSPTCGLLNFVSHLHVPVSADGLLDSKVARSID
jgi:hypothetical protein